MNDAAEVVRRHGALVGVVALAGLVAALGLLLLQHALLPAHQATTTLFLSTVSSSRTPEEQMVGEDPRPQAAPARAVAALARSSAVLQPVVERLGLPVPVERLAERVSAEVRGDGIVALTITGDSATEALTLDQAVAEQVVQATRTLGPAGASTITITAVQPAHITEPAAWDPALALGGGLLAGAVAGILAAALRAPRRAPGWDRLALHDHRQGSGAGGD